MRTLAQLYTDLGWVVHPIKPAEPGDKHTGKAPFESSWQHRATPRTEAELDKFFRGTRHNIGLLCGKTSGIMVLDIDDDNFLEILTRGLDTSAWVKSNRTNEHRRGHIFFKYDPALRSQKHHLLGLEILSDGNNCVLPPSIHYSGGVYQWQPGGPGPARVPEMPDELKNRILELFKVEIKLKELLSRARPCFRKFIDDPEKLHGGEGRRFMVALATELSAAADSLKYGSNEKANCLKMVAKLIYRDEFDSARTDKEIQGIDSARPWKCSTLSLNFSDICECSQCKFKQDAQARRRVITTGGSIDTLAVAEALQAKAPIYYDTAGAYWIWTDRGYKMVDETDLLIVAKNLMGARGITNSRMKNEYLEGVRITGRERQVLPRDPAWIQFKDRVIDYLTGETFSPSPDYFFTSPLPHNLGDSEETPLIDKLFEEWVGLGRKRLLYEILAYALLDYYPIHRIFCLIGGGRNGKGQFMKLLRKFIGIENVTSTELERIEESRFETAKLYQKKAVFIGETNFSAISKTNRLKQLSGGDIVTGEWKRKSPFDFINTAKIVIATNSLPVTHDRTDGFYSRWLVIDFPNRFKEGRDVIDPIPETEFENLGRKCLRILKELLEKGGFYQEGSIEDRARMYEEKSNPVSAFIKAHCEPDPVACTVSYELFEVFDNFQNLHGYRTLSKKQFELQLMEMGYERERAKGDFKGYFIIGLRLRQAQAPTIQLQFNPDLADDRPTPQAHQEGPEKPQERPGEQAAIFTPVPGQEVPEQALEDDPALDKDIKEAVREYTSGTMYVKNLQMFIDHFFRKHPYVKDKQKVGGRIRILKENGWRPLHRKEVEVET